MATATATASLQRVLQVAQELQDAELLIVPSTIIGQVMATRGLFRDALALFRQITDLMARWDDLTQWILTRAFLGLTEVAVGHWQEGEALAEQALARAVEIHNNTGQIYGHLFLAVIAVHTGDMRRVLLESQRTLQLAETSGDRLYCYFGHGYQALAHSRLGDHTAADESLTRQRAMAASLGGSLATADWFAAIEAEVALNAGRITAALALAEQAIELATASGGIYGEGLARRVHAQALCAAADPRRDVLDAQWAASIECFRRGGAELELARTYALWAEADPEHGGPRLIEALELYERFARPVEATRLRAMIASDGPNSPRH